MTKLESALAACQHLPLYGPVNVPDQLAIVKEQPETLGSLLYLLNMTDSRNLPWIDCVLSHLSSIGA